ncbi:SusD/RagB family nutrient-binding outer membrane lipoprotein [Pedobacter frigidisoli]|uniref:SusD/RagB family nutrient-binding outer membrane lipoprotein n=1 Tax=Pedobacter frigidisoli TaxID=2530455 RepID=A0A4R0NHF0_9SPHI|nr:SusD/RagB family nutrient-binding outer membrane lipoprotein [Pedobacter frigidisoli]TCD00030.1 SusD/RagB family nutrient-binding outer membrane lipoprotein [Pedobacter frigidisoli]
MKKIFIYTLAGLFLMASAGCKKLEDFGATNLDPNSTTQSNPPALLTNALSGLASYAYQTRPGFYGQYFSETQYPDASNYTLVQESFTGAYSGALYDLQNVQLLESTNNMKQVAKIVQQYIFWTITDRWGDVPYSQALKGIEFNAPAYDTQEAIYKGMISTLTSSVAAMDGSAIPGDIVFNGDVASWKRFANSLRMLMALQLSKRYPSATDYSATQFKAALADAGGYITTNAQNVKIVYNVNYKNPLFNEYNGRKDLAESKTMTDLMVGTLGNDPRQAAYGGASEVLGSTTSSSIGVPYGVTRAVATAFTDANTTWARVLRGDLRTESSPYVILSAAEVTLARAEAANMNWTSESQVALYTAGIGLSFEQWGVGTPSAGYLANSNVAISATPSAANLKNIAIQEYVASYPNGLRAWNIFRRTGFPALVPASAASNSTKQIPRRYVYAPSELATNLESVTAAIARLTGGNTQDARIWWDL